MRPTNWTTCWPFPLSIIIKSLFLPSWCPPDVTEAQRTNRAPQRLSGLSTLLKTHTDIYGVPAHLQLNIHEEANRLNPSATLTFTRKEQALKTCGEVSWRSWGEPWSIEGSLISLPMTRDTVVSFDAPDSKGDLLTARLQSRRNKRFIERACIYTADLRGGNSWCGVMLQSCQTLPCLGESQTKVRLTSTRATKIEFPGCFTRTYVSNSGCKRERLSSH